jgi:ABC-type sugar transport system permease subunit
MNRIWNKIHHSHWFKNRRQYEGWLFIMPLLIPMTVLMLYPALTTFYYGFMKWNGISSPKFRGIKNFTRLLSDPSFSEAMQNVGTLVLYLPIWIFIPILIAAAIRKNPLGSGFLRSVMLFPFVIAPVILGLLFNVMLRDDGPLNNILRTIGLDSFAVNWLVESNLIIHVIALITIFKFLGFGVILFLGAMGTIDESLYDAAKIDGANWWRTLLAVTIPGVRHAIEFFAVLGCITFFARMFPLIYSLTRGGPGYASFVPEFGVYYQAFENQKLGYSATWSLVVYLLTFCVIAYQIFIMKRGKR